MRYPTSKQTVKNKCIARYFFNQLPCVWKYSKQHLRLDYLIYILDQQQNQAENGDKIYVN